MEFEPFENGHEDLEKWQCSVEKKIEHDDLPSSWAVDLGVYPTVDGPAKIPH